ncbi:MAG TPA: branched-chain amino acid ABC transporter permease [Rhodopila sp.]
MTGRRLMVGVVAAGVLLLPFFLPENGVTIATRMLIAALFALAYNLLWRHGGLLSFGHAVYFGAGMFAAIHLMRLAESGGPALPLPLIPLAGALAGTIAGVVLGFLATTRGGTYFAMITLATGELAYAVGPRWDAVFGGESGISTMRMPWAGLDFGSQTQVYGLALVWFLVGAAGLHGFAATPLGRITFALGENEMRLRALGYRTHLTKTALFAISATVSGLAGALLAVANENVDYGIFTGVNSAQPVLQTFIGGAATFLGPAVGAVVLTWVGNQVSDMTRLWLLYQGLLFVAVVLYAPDGLTGLLLREREIARRAGPAAAACRVALGTAGVASLAFAVVFISEAAFVLLGEAYAMRQATDAGRWPDLHLFAHDWPALSPVTWLLPLASLLLGLALLWYAGRAARPASEATA